IPLDQKLNDSFLGDLTELRPKNFRGVLIKLCPLGWRAKIPEDHLDLEQPQLPLGLDDGPREFSVLPLLLFEPFVHSPAVRAKLAKRTRLTLGFLRRPRRLVEVAEPLVQGLVHHDAPPGLPSRWVHRPSAMTFRAAPGLVFVSRASSLLDRIRFGSVRPHGGGGSSRPR